MIVSNVRVGIRVGMPLQLQVVILSPDAMIPLYRLARSGEVVVQNLRRHLPGNACRADDEPLVKLFEVFAVGARAMVEAVGPRA